MNYLTLMRKLMRNKLIAMWYVLLGRPVAYRVHILGDISLIKVGCIAECHFFAISRRKDELV